MCIRDRSKYEQYIQQLTGQITEADTQAKQFETQNEQLQNELAQASQALTSLKKELAKSQSKPDMETAALESDGLVVSVVPRDRLAYINLGKDDHIYRGLTFAVYDSYEPIPRNGKGKGALEVIDIMDNVSKCRITDFNLSLIHISEPTRPY